MNQYDWLSHSKRIENMNAGERKYECWWHQMQRHKPELINFPTEERNIICEYYGVLRFRNENNSCCLNRKENGPALQPYLEALKHLFQGTTVEISKI